MRCLCISSLYLSRTEDLKRYQSEILSVLDYKNKLDKRDELLKRICKMYGNQVDKRILIPEQVFRGFLVSTLTCQDCHYVSPRFESFLDISLPVNVEKSLPPIRRKTSPEPIVIDKYGATTTGVADQQSPAVAQLSKKEQRAQKKKMRKAAKPPKRLPDVTFSFVDGGDGGTAAADMSVRSSSSAEQSDADIEDNVTDDKTTDTRNAAASSQYDANGNSTMEKTDDCPENENKDLNGYGVKGGNDVDDDDDDEDADDEATSNATTKEIETEMVELSISEKGRQTLMRQATNGVDCADIKEAARRMRQRTRIRTSSYTDWSTTIAPRYKSDENECSIQSCLNGFTALELMCGNNKVCCDNCTKIFKDTHDKTINTNATKQFLISSPPAVMILHLKRFQVGPRYMFRKLSKPVAFPFILDVAPFCATNIKNLPNVKRHQKKLIYSLYGIVEHSGGMHGGHYTAYVKVRPPISADDPRWQFIPKGSKAELHQTDEQEQRLESDLEKSRERERRAMANEDADSDDSLFSSSSSEQQQTNEEEAEPDIKPLPGKWYYVSDSHVREAPEDDVQKAQAYLLFYERIY